MRLVYHKMMLKRLMKEYLFKLSDLGCGRELAKYCLSFVAELEDKMDKHIKEINKLDNKNFPLFKEGYVPLGVIN